ncbi:MAG: hypothetical protein ACK4WH_03430 [Phycisphaerales bacterium]
MSWPVALVFGYLLLAIELVIPAELRIGSGDVAPSFIVPFVVYIAMFAPAMVAYWAAVWTGLALDLASPRGAEAFIIVGPNAIGLLAAAYVVVTLRAVVNRNPLALVVFSIIAAAMCGLVVVAIFTLRSWYTPQIVWHAGGELSSRLFSAVYTGLSAAVVGLCLFPLHGLFRFQDPYARRVGASARAF